MNILWKGAAALGLTITALGAAAVPAQAQYYGYGDGYRGEWRGHRDWDRDRDGRWDRRRWHDDDRRYWRDGRDNYRYRQRCWTEWRYDYYRDRDVRIRICR
ncbi:hypothetical protein [Sphingobium mellinum]|uniref:hypothetical protein n=1 Tax=Sphingobium mellinum TaxID=1387166 RepID=UPI0030EBD709